jgi:acetyl-CoA carboxylase biotin carboxylase subunit
MWLLEALMFSKILIANRGEIALRVIRACKDMGIATVAVFSQADRNCLHVSLADESYCIGSPLSKDSYLDMNAIIAVALFTKAQAIHPGYGFLSENSEFANLCEKNGIVFIGPGAQAITEMGDKSKAKNVMAKAGLPVVPGCELGADMQENKKAAEEVGFPLLIKASCGGGGRGIRLVTCPKEFESNFKTAASEAKSSFGDGSLYIEKFLKPVKHIEVQILGDNYGNVVCLGERDCSAQRKNQKLIEESPAAILPEQTRKEMHRLSITAGKAINYRGAGTIEFLYDKEGSFYFIEMNTRLQVEHPVTEMVAGVDLVKWQIRVAAGIKLAFAQEDIKLRGHAIECRINADNPRLKLSPSGGRIETFHVPGGPWVRFDSHIYQGYSIPPYYDSLIGKLIVYENTREEAIRKMKAALCELIIEGVEHSADFNGEILSTEEFESACYTTDLIPALLSAEEEN